MFILDITWDVGVVMPKYVGPFDSEAEAREFARINVPNGVAAVAKVADPYLRPECMCYSTRDSRCRAHDHQPAEPARCVKCGGPDGFHDPACIVHPGSPEPHDESTCLSCDAAREFETTHSAESEQSG